MLRAIEKKYLNYQLHCHPIIYSIKTTMKFQKIFLMTLLSLSVSSIYAQKWTAQKANEWYAKQGTLTGANFIPSTAINQLEMFQADTFDSTTIDRELGCAESLGMNVMRVYLHDLLYQEDKDGFLKRMDELLKIADKHHIKILFVFFDSC